MSVSTSTFMNSVFSFEATTFKKFGAFESNAENVWNLLLGNKQGNRKTSADSCDTATTGEESINESSTGSPRNSWNWQNNSESSESQEESSTVLNSAMKPKKKAAVDDTKYKTELCKNWMETGRCPYGKKCKFAHGKHELNEKFLANQRRYKSKKCNSFHTKMSCPYGSRCLFAHEDRTLEEVNASNCGYEKFLTFPELLNNRFTNRKIRLPTFISATISTNSKDNMGFSSKIFVSFDEEEEQEFSDILKLTSQ